MNISTLLSFTTKIEGAYEVMRQPLLNEFEMSKTSFDILMFLSNNPDRYTAKEISTTRNIKANVVSLHVEKLVNDGYLQRQSVEGDRRKVRLVYTEKAQPIIEKGRELQRNFCISMMEGLTEEDLASFKHCFQVIAENADLLHGRKMP